MIDSGDKKYEDLIHYFVVIGSCIRTSIFLIGKKYELGLKGEVGKCPYGYYSIYNHNMCKQASSNLTIFYSKELGDGKENSICNLCGHCDPNRSRMTKGFGKKGKMICVDEDQGTLNTIISSSFISKMYLIICCLST